MGEREWGVVRWVCGGEGVGSSEVRVCGGEGVGSSEVRVCGGEGVGSSEVRGWGRGSGE